MLVKAAGSVGRSHSSEGTEQDEEAVAAASARASQSATANTPPWPSAGGGLPA